MSLPFTNVTVTRLQLAERDTSGLPLGAPVETDIPGCLLAPAASTEATSDADTTATHLVVYAPSGTVVASTDQIRVNGTDYYVDGEPQVWTSPFPNGPEGVEIHLSLTRAW